MDLCGEEIMKCPNCGEKRTSTIKELWGDGAPQFWSHKKEVLFICGGRYIYDEDEHSYEEVKPCKRNKV